MSGFETSPAGPGAGDRPSARVAILADDAVLIASVRAALLRQGGPEPVVLATHRALLGAVLRGPGGFTLMLVQPGAAHVEAMLLDALAEASPDARIVALPAAGDVARIEGMLAAGALPRMERGQPDPGEAAGSPRGLQDGGLLLRYQPIVRVRDRRLVMFEALARWRSEPVALGPGSFVPAMERAGLARLLAAAVTRIATRDMMRFGRALGVPISVNLPVEELEKRDVEHWLAMQMRGTRLPRGRVALELTETSPVKDLARLRRSVRRLRRAGHEVLIDDFELDDRRRRLLRLPFSGVKLDKGLVEALPGSARARLQVRALARLGLAITAEGVSSAAIFQGLRRLGVQRAQGFWVARPLPVAALPAWAARWRAAQPRQASA